MYYTDPYQWSKDYDRLKELLDAGNQIICLVDNNFSIGGKMYVCKDICTAYCRRNEQTGDFLAYTLSSRGHGYGDVYLSSLEKCSFSEWMEAWGVEFIDPDSQKKRKSKDE